jgi:hypothetical protein
MSELMNGNQKTKANHNERDVGCVAEKFHCVNIPPFLAMFGE